MRLSHLSVCLCMCIYSCVHLHLQDSLILSLSASNGAASGTALYYLSGPVNSKAITHLCVFVREWADWKVYESRCVWAIGRHHCHSLPHVNITRKSGVHETMANRAADFEIFDWQWLKLLLPSCQRSAIHFWSSLIAVPHVHSKPNETLDSFPRLSPPLVS